DDAPPRRPLGAGGPYVVVVEDLDHGRPREPHVDRRAGGAEGDGGEEYVAQALPRVGREGHVADEEEESQRHRQDEDQDDADEEVRNRYAGHGDPGRDLVGERASPDRGDRAEGDRDQ